jgi:aminoglycoside phosphotransferase (APT) family kinase protein
MDTTAADTSTGKLLLATLREVTGRPDLTYATDPTPLTGGFYAEMLRFRLASPPPGLDRELVARVVPNAEAGEWEATIQRNVADQGFPTPTVRLTAPDSSPLGRFLLVMDLVEGVPPLAGLRLGTIATQIPTLLRHLPDQLAGVAAELHALDARPLAAELDALDTAIASTTTGFVEQHVLAAQLLDRPDIAAAGERLLAAEPASSVTVISHGDLHPFNLLVTPTGPALIDWTVARVAHPGFTVGFTELMLANPPIPVPKAASGPLRSFGRTLARRFLASYRDRTEGTDAAVDDENLDWHRKVHALRILVELAGWDEAGTRPASGHPWLILEPIARRALGIDPDPSRG